MTTTRKQHKQMTYYKGELRVRFQKENVWKMPKKRSRIIQVGDSKSRGLLNQLSVV
jgi:hypothetical protein